MVTIEKKLSLFTKLIYEKLQNETKEEFEELKKSNEETLLRKIEEFKQKKLETIKTYIEEGESVKSSIIAKANVESKKQILNRKNQFLEIVIDQVKKRLIDFTNTKEYEVYLLRNLKDIFKEFEENIGEIWIINKQEKIIKEIIKNHFELEELNFKNLDEDYLGGFIVYDKEKTFKYDITFKSELNELNDYIGIRLETYFKEVGESYE